MTNILAEYCFGLRPLGPANRARTSLRDKSYYNSNDDNRSNRQNFRNL